MKSIHSKKYEKVVKLLKSSNKADNILGVEALRYYKFTDKELRYNFPSKDIPERNFERSTSPSNPNLLAKIGSTALVVNDRWVFAFEYDPADEIYYDLI